MKILRRLFDKIMELIYPSNIYCIFCESIINESCKYAICNTCVNEINWVNENSCDICGKYLNNPKSSICEDCSEVRHFFDKGYTCMVYDKKVKKLINDFKYKGKSYVAEKLADIIEDKIKFENIQVDLITYVPSHKRKESKRGYNPTKLIAKNLSSKINIPIKHKLIKRVKDDKSMNKLTKNQRKLNLENSYKPYNCDDLSNKSVLLIDDVYTTGTTVDECSKILREIGASNIIVMTIAAGAS